MATLLVEKVVQPAIRPAHVAICPSIDLVALATVDDKVHVSRFSGQEVFCVSDRNTSGPITSVLWKADGQLIAVASERLLNVNNSRTGKVVHRIDCSRYSESPVSCAGWATHLISPDKSESKLHTLQSRIALQEDDNPTIENGEAESLPNLPQDLASLAVEDFLPKLSPLPSGGMDDDIFSSRVSLDTIFRSFDARDLNRADVLVLGFRNASVLVSIYDFFDVGVFSIEHLFLNYDACYPIRHCSHALSTTHALLIQGSGRLGTSLNLLPVDLRLLSNAKKHLPILASKTTQVRYLLRYIKQIQLQLYGDLKTALDVPRRFMSNIEEALSEKGEWNWTQAAYHLVMTGHCPPEVKEWLVDQLGEWGHKRWDKAVFTGYDNARRLTHENLLPALERFMVVASRLRGLSKYPKANHHLGLSTRQLDSIIDNISSLQLLSHQVLVACNSERQQFQAFSLWLRQEIDKQASEGDRRDDGNATTFNVQMVLRYISQAMLHSDLLRYLDLGQPDQKPSDIDPEEHEGANFKLHMEKLTQKSGPGIETSQMPYLDALIKYLDTQCTMLFKGIADTQRKGVRFGTPRLLAQGEYEHIDMHMSLGSGSGGSTTDPDGSTIFRAGEAVPKQEIIQYVALARRASHLADVYRIPTKIENGISSYQQLEYSRISLGEYSLHDIRFLGEQELLLAVSHHSTARLLAIPLEKLLPASADGLGSKSEEEGSGPLLVLDLSMVESIDSYTWIEFPEGKSWTPQRIELGQRKGKSVVCVVAQDGLRYRIYESKMVGHEKTTGMDLMDE